MPIARRHTEDEKSLNRVKSFNPQERLIYFIKERESIRIRKERGNPKPWTQDPILRDYRFTNIRRMDDRVSQWLLRNWYEPFFDHRLMVPACALARFINEPSNLGLITFPRTWEPTRIKRLLHSVKDSGKRVFNPAYIIHGTSGIGKIEAVVDYYVGPLVDSPIEVDRTSMENTWNQLQRRYGYGSFMAGQVIADLRWAMKGTWEDRNTWAPLGPGSKKGMNRLQGREEKCPLSQGSFLDELLQMRDRLREELPSAIMDRLELFDLQNVCCEMSKYERTLWGQGKPKQSYPGQSSPG